MSDPSGLDDLVWGLLVPLMVAFVGAFLRAPKDLFLNKFVCGALFTFFTATFVLLNQVRGHEQIMVMNHPMKFISLIAIFFIVSAGETIAFFLVDDKIKNNGWRRFSLCVILMFSLFTTTLAIVLPHCDLPKPAPASSHQSGQGQTQQSNHP